MHVQTYGVVQTQAASTATPALAGVLEQLLVRGVAVVEGVFSAEAVADMNRRLDAVYARQCEEIGGEANLLAMSDADIVRAPLAYDDAFLDLALHPTIRDVATGTLGENVVLLMQNGIINRPDRLQFQTKWHRDLNYQHWVCSKPLAISALVALEDFTDELGGTVFLPGSQKSAEFPSEQFVQRFEENSNARAGSVIFFDAMTFHRAGVNRGDRIRRAINHVIGAPILAPQTDFPAMLDRAPPADLWASGYLGYRWSPVASVTEWRRRKLAAKA